MSNTINCIRENADSDQLLQCQNILEINKNSFALLSNTMILAGNHVRLKILYLLHKEGELCPCDLSDILGMTVSAISQHLRKLREGELITSRRAGQTIFYSITFTHLDLLTPFFDQIDLPKQVV